jgi:hypothetical protein
MFGDSAGWPLSVLTIATSTAVDTATTAVPAAPAAIARCRLTGWASQWSGRIMTVPPDRA